jgi:predicted aspartyl protease
MIAGTTMVVYLINAYMKKIICGLLMMSFSCACHSQEILTPREQAKFITRFKFKQYSGGVMIVNALLNDKKDTLNFILDTGSGGISLDSATCAQLGYSPRLSDTTITGMGTARKVSYIYKQQLHFPGLTVNNLDFHINNYEILTSVYGEKIDGIIGYSFLSRYIVKVNFDSLELEVFSPGEIKYPSGGTTLRPAFTTLPIQNIHFKDSKKFDFNFYFDTGAGLCFLLSDAYAADSNVLHRKRKPIETQAEGMGGRLKMRLTVVKMLQIGKFKFRNVPTYVFDDYYNVTSYPFVGGLIGNDLLRRFNVTLNYPAREIHILANSHFLEPFDYAYTGLAMYYINGRIVVDDVVPGSPAEKAGLKPLDIVISVGNSFTNNIMQYKTTLQTTGERIRMIVQRDGKIMQLTIRPQSIL